jgi:uncharacterized protein (TIGR03086 family)
MHSYDLLVAAESRLVALTTGLAPAALDLPTPCEQWDVRGLLNHTVRTIEVFAAAVDGGPGPTDAEVFDGPDLLGDAPDAVVRAAVARSQAAWATVPGFHGDLVTAFGTMPTSTAISVSTFSTLVHGWDLGRALGLGVELSPDLLDLGEAVAAAIVPPLRERGRFGPPAEVGADAGRTERFIAFTGRSPV